MFKGSGGAGYNLLPLLFISYQMKFLIKFPSRNRPKQFKAALEKYILFSDKDKTHFLFTLDSNDPTLGQYVDIIQSADINHTLVVGDSTGKIDAVNRDLNEFLMGYSADVILLASDDMMPLPMYQEKIEERARELGLDYVYWFQDGNQSRLNTLSIMGIEYYRRFNYLYHPSYKSLWCDNEFHDVALSLERMNETPFPMIIEHQHPAHNRQYKTDELYKENDRWWNHDKENYEKRKANNFK